VGEPAHDLQGYLPTEDTAAQLVMTRARRSSLHERVDR